MRIYWNPLSSPANRVVFCANYLGIEYDKILVDLAKGEQLTEQHKAMHPFGKVPVIDDDGYTLFESGAINNYLARKQKSSLYPSTFEERAQVDQWSDVASLTVSRAVNQVLFNRFFAPMLGEQPDQKAIDQGLNQLKINLPVVNDYLSARDYFVGDEITLADISMVAALDPLEVISYDISGLTHLDAWRKNMHSKKFYTDTHQYYGEGILTQ